MTLYVVLSTYNCWYFILLEKQTLFIGKNLIKWCNTKSTQKWQCKQQSLFQYLQVNFSVLSSCLMEERRLVASHSSALLLSLITSFTCQTCSCHGFFSLRFQRRKLGLLIRMEKQREKNHSYSKGNPVKSHFKRNSILGYTYTAFVAVWAVRTVFSVWVLGTW